MCINTGVIITNPISNLDLWPFKLKNHIISRIFQSRPSLTSLGSIVFELCCGQTNKQTDGLEHPRRPRIPRYSSIGRWYSCISWMRWYNDFLNYYCADWKRYARFIHLFHPTPLWQTLLNPRTVTDRCVTHSCRVANAEYGEQLRYLLVRQGTILTETMAANWWPATYLLYDCHAVWLMLKDLSLTTLFCPECYNLC